MIKPNAGFTLVEMIIVIVITGIIGGMVAIFLRAPVQGYIDSERRAELTDIADTAMRRMARDVRTAVPNSVRFTNCTAPCVEFIPTKDGGRYRAAAGGNGNLLVFGAGGTTVFDIVGTAIPITAGTDFIVIGSTQSNGAPPYDQTAAGVLRSVTAMAIGNTRVTFAGPVLPAWAELPSQRFDVVDGTQQAVTYACEGVGIDANGTGTGQLARYWGYGFAAAPGVNRAILADRVSACAIDYGVTNQRFGLLGLRLTLSSGGENVTLYNEIHVNNAP
ncbi:MAG TPA: prepilin-type N-terminal cleavage/methylation domain-containing protein [Sideroxyarcus sp.]|nr:prepilin-type N-terminal cleavage/methylation domain-containing protein [Sideroxyarcus sp.]